MQNLLDHANAERILEEGWHLFQQRGYRGATIDELCLRCQLSKPTVYYYFKDKENLFVQVLQHKLHDFQAAAEQSGSLNEKLESVAKAILTSFQKEYSPLLRDREHIKKPENLKKIRDAFRGSTFWTDNRHHAVGHLCGGVEGRKTRNAHADIPGHD